MLNLNLVIIIGNLTRDVELRALEDGKYVASFDLATNDSYKNKAGVKVETVEFVRCSAFGKSAELIAQYMKKGSQILIQGKLKTHSWEKDGVKHYQTRVVVNSFKFGTSPQSTGDAGSVGQSPDPLAKEFEPKPVQSDTPEPKGTLQADSFEYPTEDIRPEDIPF